MIREYPLAQKTFELILFTARYTTTPIAPSGPAEADEYLAVGECTRYRKRYKVAGYPKVTNDLFVARVCCVPERQCSELRVYRTRLPQPAEAPTTARHAAARGICPTS